MDIMDINDECKTLTLLASTSANIEIGRSNYVSIYNPSSSLLYVKTGDSDTVADVTHAWIPPEQAISFRKEAKDTHLAAFCTDAVIINIQAGKGV